MASDVEKLPFRSLYKHGFFRVAIATPLVSLARPDENAKRVIDLARRAAQEGAGLVLFPELGLSGYSIDDLFFQDVLLDAVRDALDVIAAASAAGGPIIVVGAPLRSEGHLFNCAVVIHGGGIIGVVPKTYLPNYREFYEKRQFCSAAHAGSPSIRLHGRALPFGNDLIFEVPSCPGFALHVEICEDLWVPIPPSTRGALAGATVLANLSASNASIGKADYRRLLCASQSGRCVAAYLYASAGFGESTTDLAWDGHSMIYENAELLAEGVRYADEPRLFFADLDLDRLAQERARLTSLADCARHFAAGLDMRRLAVPFVPPQGELPLRRAIPRFPYVPDDAEACRDRCREVFAIQVQGLAQRLAATHIEKVVIGVSGGLDSAHALLVAAGALDRLRLPRSNLLAYSLPGFATGSQSRENAWRLMRSIGCTAGEIDIRPSAQQMLADIGHPASRGVDQFDTTYENVQAGERASHLFRLANLNGALVVGTSDLSELALGYTTYGIGDHMAHYGVNSSVPKTLLRHLIQWAIENRDLPSDTVEALRAILAAPATPELIPGRLQQAEAEIGPYALQDFNLYYTSRYGFRPSKIAFMAEHAWGSRLSGESPVYDLPTIKKWLGVFLERFIASSQFKRSALPNGPKIGSGGSLSPRADWRAPSDVGAALWLDELRRNVP
jgi:NAD+ synthase (glutamine-hydrolysing)